MGQNTNQDASMDVRAMMSQRQAEMKQEAQYNHGDYVPGENGEAGGFLIDTEEQMRKATEIPEINDVKKYVQNQQNQITRIQNGEDPNAVMMDTDTTTHHEETNNINRYL